MQNGRIDAGADETSSVQFIRGDVDENGILGLPDVIAQLVELFVATGTSSACQDAVDFNDDGDLTLSDVIENLDYLFSGGLPPAAPFPGCGTDSTVDILDCRDSSAFCP